MARNRKKKTNKPKRIDRYGTILRHNYIAEEIVVSRMLGRQYTHLVA